MCPILDQTENLDPETAEDGSTGLFSSIFRSLWYNPREDVENSNQSIGSTGDDGVITEGVCMIS